MPLRHLPDTVREILSTLRRSFGPPGVVLAVVALPFVLSVALLSFPFVWVVRRLRPSARRPHRTLEIHGSDLALSWTGDARGCRAALEDALRVVLAGVADAEPVGSLEIRNPETGFAIDPAKLKVIDEADHVAALAAQLSGEWIELGELVVNRERRLIGLTADSRSGLAGHLGLELPEAPGRRAAVARARELGFEVLLA